MPVVIALPRQVTCRGRPTFTETILIASPRVSRIFIRCRPGAGGYDRNDVRSPCIESA